MRNNGRWSKQGKYSLKRSGRDLDGTGGEMERGGKEGREREGGTRKRGTRREGRNEKVRGKERKRTSRPKARDGHRYPCPALEFPDGSSEVSRAAAPEGTGGDEVL